MIRLSELAPDVQASVRATRERGARRHAALPATGRVVGTAGNVSERVPGADLFVIKPSGVRYSELSPDNMTVCTLEGEKIDDGTPASLNPSSDTAAVAYVFRHMPEVGGVVHTHSTYATAFAALHRPIPCVLTMMGDEFGGEVPVGPFAIIGDDSIGRGIVETLRSSRSPAVLMANHGPFTVGKDAEAAVKAAAMVEEVARTVATAQLLGDPVPVAQEHIDALYQRYQNVYGQR